MDINIKGASKNNLQEIDVKLPRNKLIVVTGVSGSGKSSLIFDTLFNAAQSELLDSINTYARRTMPRINPPPVSIIKNLSPAIAIDQKPLSRNPRSTIGTVTDIYSFLRLLFSRLGTPILSAGEFSFNTPKGACEACSGLGSSLKPKLEALLDINKSLEQGAILHRTWKVNSRYWNIISAVGMFDMKKPLRLYSEKEMDDLLYHPPIEYTNREPGYIQTFSYEGVISRLMKRLNDSRGRKEYDNQFFITSPCQSCDGSRLNSAARAVTIGDYNIVDLLNLEIRHLRPLLEKLEGTVAEQIIRAIIPRLKYMEQVGIGYLSINRPTDTLSGGESQRVKLARQLGSSFCELIYILDEPSIGLHPSDKKLLVKLLRSLTDKPNTVVAVEHDVSIMRASDIIIDLGPGAGIHGGKILNIASPNKIAKTNTPTGDALSGKQVVPIPKFRRQSSEKIQIRRASLHNLKNVDVDFPIGTLSCITGVSGSGKSSLIQELLKQIPSTIIIDQSPIGGSSRSIVATYVRAFDKMRSEFAEATGMPPSLFAFNSNGACPDCDGLGYKIFDMHFLGDVREVCEKCNGRRFSEKTLQFRYRGHSIADILDLTVEQVQNVFDAKVVRSRFKLLNDVGVGYLRVGQSLTALSGGERQRIKIAQRLSMKSHTYVLDEPTRGLHPVDVSLLVKILEKLVSAGNTVILVEHDLDIIKCADWIIDLGPGGGMDGGNIIAQGTPEQIADSKESLTGKFLREALPSNT